MSQALTTACARLFLPMAGEMRNLSRQLQLSPAKARWPGIVKLLLQLRAHFHDVLLQDCVHQCGVWCASEARLQAGIKIGRLCSCLRQHNKHLTICIQTTKHVSRIISQTHSNLGISMHAYRQCSHAQKRTIRRVCDGQN
eukprot:6200263-Pleurochrysis_carterae.AAC.1